MVRLLSCFLLSSVFGCHSARALDDHPVRVVAEALVIDISVNTYEDILDSGGTCSLRESLLAAGGTTGNGCPTPPTASDTARVVLQAGTYAIAIPPAFNEGGQYIAENAGLSGDLDLPPRGVEIVGAGSALTTLSGAGYDRVLHAMGGTPGCAITLRKLRVTGGCAHGGTCEAGAASGGYPARGGALYDNGGCFLDLTDDVVIEENHGGEGGGLAICATAVKPMAQLGAITIRNNVGTSGGGLNAHVPWRCDGCVIENNTALHGGARRCASHLSLPRRTVLLPVTASGAPRAP